MVPAPRTAVPEVPRISASSMVQMSVRISKAVMSITAVHAITSVRQMYRQMQKVPVHVFQENVSISANPAISTKLAALQQIQFSA